MRVPVLPSTPGAFIGASGPDQEELVRMVSEATRREMTRTASRGGIYNSRLEPDMIKESCPLDEKARSLFREKTEELGLSMRACHSVLKVARTIADIEGRSVIGEEAVAEAARYRAYGDGDCFWPF
jgi:magnesium chelatase family protein